MIEVTVNGTRQQLEVDPAMPLLWVLRDVLDLTGTKYGCGMAQCGACTVHLDGTAVRACVTPISAVQGKTITTIEGLDSNTARAVQEAWKLLDVVQCGYCQSGQIMSAIDLLQRKQQPSDTDIDTAMTGNICRCNTYVRIRAAIKHASRALVQGG